MVSCFKRLTSISLLALTLSCGDDGVAPGILAVTNPRIFVTTAVAPTFGGATGADSVCRTQAQSKGLDGTFKALISSGARRPCTTANCSGGVSENLSWVLLPDQTYYQEDGTTVIGTTTDAAIFDFPLTTAISETSANVWTGLYPDWTAADNCDNWFSTANLGTYGSASELTGDSIGFLTNQCSNNYSLYCVEQAGTGPSTANDVAPCTTCKIFVTTATFTGDLGGTSGANDKCNADAQSGSEVYKALLGFQNPLYANTDYIRPDGTPIGSTNGSRELTFPLTNSITTVPRTVWTGIASNWANFNTCSFWTNGTGTGNSNYGDSSSANSSMLNSSIVTCENTHRIYCVQQ